MTARYLRSTDGNNADDGSTWALAKATLAGLYTASAAGDIGYVSHVHAETFGSNTTLTSPGTDDAPMRIICGNDAAEPPTTPATTASILATASSFVTLSFDGSAYFYGISFSATANASAAMKWSAGSGTTPCCQIFENCTFILQDGRSSAGFSLGNANVNKVQQRIIFVNCVFKFSHINQLITLGCGAEFYGCSVDAAGTIPTTLFNFSRVNESHVMMVGCNWSALGSGKNLFDQSTLIASNVQMVDCRLGASVTIVTGTHAGQGGPKVHLHSCNSGAVNYTDSLYDPQGTVTTESTIVKTDGQSDGTTSSSRKMVTASYATIDSPLCTEWVEFWNETTGSSVTVAASVLTDNVTLTDAEAWVEVAYRGSSSYPVATLVTDKVAVLGTPANQATESPTWTTTGLGTPVKQSLSVTFTPQMKGPIRARVCLAKPSTTMYADLKLLTGSGRQWQSLGSVINEGASGGALNPLTASYGKV